mgnify:CR=1 FL=1
MTEQKKHYEIGEGYMQIVSAPPKYDKEGILIEVEQAVYYCVMCGQEGKYLAPETNEVLCLRCLKNNDEARGKK